MDLFSVVKKERIFLCSSKFFWLVLKLNWDETDKQERIKQRFNNIYTGELWFWRRPLESPLYHKEIQLVSPKGNQSWIFTEMIDTEAETPVLWPPDAKSSHIGKDPDAGKDWGQGEKGMTEDEMVR